MIPRSRSSGALSIWSNGTNSASPFLPCRCVIAAVNVVLPWSTCPIVPTFTCGFVRSNFSLAMRLSLEFCRACPPRAGATDGSAGPIHPMTGAHERDRTADLVLTKDVLYQLSYVGRTHESEWSGKRDSNPRP